MADVKGRILIKPLQTTLGILFRKTLKPRISRDPSVQSKRCKILFCIFINFRTCYTSAERKAAFDGIFQHDKEWQQSRNDTIMYDRSKS